MDQSLEILIKHFVEQGKKRSEIITELVYQGYDPHAVEDELNALYEKGEISEDFWNKNGTHPETEVSYVGETYQVASSSKKKKIFIGGVVALVLIGAGVYGWYVYHRLPKIVANAAYEKLSDARSFEFNIRASSSHSMSPDIAIEGIIILKNPSALTGVIRTQKEEKNIFSLHVIKKEGTSLIFKTEGSSALDQYAWIASEQETFFSEAEELGIGAFSSRLSFLKNMSVETGASLKNNFEKIMKGAMVSSEAKEFGMKGTAIEMKADAVFKRQLVSDLVGLQDVTLLDDVSVARWIMIVPDGSAGKYIFIVKPYTGLLGETYSSILISIQNINMHADIPFDAVTTPLEKIVQWKNQ